MYRVNNDPNGTTTASDYDVHHVLLHTQNSEAPIDITKMVNYIEIFESIYSPFLTVNININDTLSLPHVLPIIGEEYVELDIRGPDQVTGIIKQTFYIYKLSDKVQTGDKAYIYTLNCISHNAIIDMNLKISQSISGQPSDLVQTKFCQSSMSVEKPIYSHPTKNSVGYISNYWSPTQNIQYLSERAVSRDTGAASYLFFETKRQFNFVPVDALVAQDSNWTYFNIPNTHATGIQEQQSIIHKMTVDETFNYIDRLMDGGYGNRTLTIDPTRKKYQYTYYDFLESYDKYSRLNELPFATDKSPRRINSVFKHRVAPSKSSAFMPNEMTGDWLQKRITELAAINSQRITFEAAGRFNIYAGNVIEVVVPISDVGASDSGERSIRNAVDRSLSGRYLVNSIRHLLTRERHTISIQASKDSMIKK